MRRRPKTPEELRADLKAFDAAWKREMIHVMRNAVERMTAAGSGRRLPAKYKMKLPQLLRTFQAPSPSGQHGPSAVAARYSFASLHTKEDSSPIR